MVIYDPLEDIVLNYAYLTDFSRYVLPVLAVTILVLCLAALLRRHPQPLGNVKIHDSGTKEDYILTSRETSLGSHKDCDIVLKYPTVSKHHAVIICGKDGWYIKKTGREDKPVIVNGKKIEKTSMLTSGDKISLGEAVLYFDNTL